jgi:hypothetical protein
MARFLFVTWDGSGNQTPALGMAQALRERGHEVAFAGYESQQGRIAAQGFRFSVLERSSAALHIPANGNVMATMAAGVGMGSACSPRRCARRGSA